MESRLVESAQHCVCDTIAVKYCDVPQHLRNGHFFQALNAEEENSEILIPRLCFSVHCKVDNLQELEQSLRVISYWVLYDIPESVIEYCVNNDYASWCIVVRTTCSELPVAKELKYIFQPDPDDSLARAIAVGRTEIVTYLTVRQIRSEKAVVLATKGNRLDYLQLLRSNGYVFNKEACEIAAEHGHLDCLRYLHENGCALNHNVYLKASKGNHFNCIKYAYSAGLSWHSVGEAFAMAGQFDFLAYAVERGCPLTKKMPAWAAYGGHLDCLRFLLEANCPIDARAGQDACYSSRIESLKLLHEHGAPWNAETTATAAEYGQLACLQYLHEHGCPWNETTTREAAKNCNLSILRYALENGCNFFPNIVEEVAASSSAESLECMKYLIEEQNIYMNDDGVAFAAAFGQAHLAMMEYLIDVGYSYQNWSARANAVWIASLAMHAKPAQGDGAYLEKYDQKLLICIKLAADRGCVLPARGTSLIFIHFPLCNAYLETEGFVHR